MFISGSQFSEHNVTPGTCPLEPSLSLVAHKPPGAVQVVSVAQNSIHIATFVAVLTHIEPGAQSLLFTQV